MLRTESLSPNRNLNTSLILRMVTLTAGIDFLLKIQKEAYQRVNQRR